MNITRTFVSLTDCYSDQRLVLVTLLLSSALGLSTMALGLSVVVIANATVLPWAILIARKLHGDWTRYGWLALFELIVILQLAHFAEHVSQMVELHVLDWPTVKARGIIGDLDIEPVHFWWNTLILAATTGLLFHYRKNGWLWVSFFFSIWHEVEHVYIYFAWFLTQGISGHPGILGAGGILDQADVTIPLITELSRADLHFWYNFFEIGLFVVAFVVQALRTMNAPIARRPHFAQRVLLTVGAIQIPLIIGIALVQHTPSTFSVPAHFATIQEAIDAAPGWAIIDIAPGTYNETIEIRKPLTLIGATNGATRIGGGHTPQAIIAVRNTHDVTLRNLNVVGGQYGILVENSQGVQLQNNRVMYAWFAGIRLSRAAATITGNEVRGTFGTYGMGIELANTISKPPSTIRGNVVADNSQEGIVLHNAHALIERNTVTGNNLRGIAITEMSMATVRANTLASNCDAGIYVVDHSMAEVHGNQVRAMRPGPQGAADGVRAYYYAQVKLGRNQIEVAPERAVVAGYNAIIETQ